MAVVFLARDLKHDRAVAIKVVRPEIAAALGPERFLREIEIAARLTHPHILPLLDSGDVDGVLYYVMPYIAGESLRQRLSCETQLSVEDALAITRQVASALAYAHSHDVMHRDIKPENILLQGDEVLVADFGIARAITAAGGEKLTETGIAVGTPAYMSPEQGLAERTVDGRSDIYSLGCVLYEMLAGEPPYTGPTAQAILARRLADPVPPLRTVRETVPAHVERAIERALAKLPADRFTTATQFADALTGPVMERRGLRWRGVLITSAAVVIVSVGVAQLRARHRESIMPSTSVIAVIPFAPSVPDTALSRLGRDLVFTISASLDGVGSIRAADPHTVLIQSEDRSAPYSVHQATGLGRRLGAGSVVFGSLVRNGREVRLDFQLLESNSATTLARVTVTDSPDSIVALTDSATWTLLRQIWRRGEPPTPSLVEASTRSMPALRAFLEGERALAAGEARAAVQAFGRAIEADSTFWLAYWRYVDWKQYVVLPVEPTVYQALWDHRGEVRGVDSLLIEADQGPVFSTLSVRFALGERATREYPDNWWAWFFHADGLVHTGPRLGYRIADARAALERTLALNPKFADGWSHLLMVTIGNDSMASANAFETIRRLSHDARWVRGWRLFSVLDRNGGIVDTVLADSVARDAGGLTLIASRMSAGFLGFGFPAAQIAYDRRELRRATRPVAPLLRLSLARSWAARGAWDSALVAADEYAAAGEDDSAAIEGYRVAVIGAWIGALAPSAAGQRRSTLAHSAEQLPPISRAELAWLDGLLAVTLRDSAALRSARARLQVSADSAWPVLDRSLAAFGAELAGARRRAADSLAAIEWQRPDFVRTVHGSQGVRTHPFLTGINRLAAAHWLLQSGDTVQASRLLTWHETRMWLPAVHLADAVLAGLADLERARIEDARGRPDLAREYYERFLSRYDMPVPAHRQLVEEARAAVVRLNGRKAAR